MDPTANEGVSAFSGLEYFRALREGSFVRPSMLVLFDINIETAEPGVIVLTATPTAEHYNPMGFVHGGYAAVLLDTCMGAAILTSLEPGLSAVTLEYKINFARPMSADTGVVRGRGRRYTSVGRWPSPKADCSTRRVGFSPTGRPPAMSRGKGCFLMEVHVRQRFAKNSRATSQTLELGRARMASRHRVRCTASSGTDSFTARANSTTTKAVMSTTVSRLPAMNSLPRNVRFKFQKKWRTGADLHRRARVSARSLKGQLGPYCAKSSQSSGQVGMIVPHRTAAVRRKVVIRKNRCSAGKAL
jgi:uncharacterized protein (TIGR00369 family)